jgi:hypothetical protein
MSSTIGRSRRRASTRDHCARGEDDPDPTMKLVALDLFEFGAQRRGGGQQTGAADDDLECAHRLEGAHLASHGALLLRVERARPRIGAGLLQGGRAVGAHELHRDDRGVGEQSGGDLSQFGVVLEAQRSFHGGGVRGGEIARQAIEAARFGAQ